MENVYLFCPYGQFPSVVEALLFQRMPAMRAVVLLTVWGGSVSVGGGVRREETAAWTTTDQTPQTM